MSDPRPTPTRRHLAEACIWALLAAVLFLRSGVLPTNALVPFAPEVYEPLRSEVLASGEFTVSELDAGNPSMGDKYNQSLAWDRILADRLRDGSLPLWTRDIGGGVPFVPQMAQVFQPWNLLLAALPFPSCGIYGIWFALHLAAFGVFAYWFMRRIGTTHAAALLGLICVELGFWMQARVHHNVIVSAALPLFPLLSLVDGASRHRAFGPGRIALFALGCGISWLGGFAPVSLQTCGLVLAFAVLRAVETRSVRPLLGIGLGFALGAIIALPQMGPTLLASTISARLPMLDTDLSANGMTWSHLRTLVFPDLFSWPDTRMVGGAAGPPWAALDALPMHKAAAFNFPETAFAIGLPGLLAALAAFRRPRILVVFLGMVALGAFGLATAEGPFLGLAHWIPGARAGDLRRFLYLVAMTLAVLAALGADRMTQGRRDPAAALCALGIAALALWPLLGLLGHNGDLDSFRLAWAQRLAGEREGLQVSVEQVLASMGQRPFEAANNYAALLQTFARTAIVALAAAALCWFARGAWRLRGLAALGGLELLVAGLGTLVPVSTERVERLPALLGPVADATRQAERAGQPRPRLHRIDPLHATRLFPPNLGAFHHLEDLGSYNPLAAARMEEFFDVIEPRKVGERKVPGASQGGAGVAALRRIESIHHPLLDLLGCRYVLVERSLLGNDLRGLIDRTPVGLTGRFGLFERTTAMPRATFLDRITRIPERAARLAALATSDLRTTTILEAAEAPDPGGDGIPDADLRIVLHSDTEVVIELDAREAGYLRLADPYDPGWTATIDGDATTVLAADHYLRAVFVPPGTHRIVFRFDGWLRVRIWNLLGLLGLVTAIGLLVAGRRAVRRDAAA